MEKCGRASGTRRTGTHVLAGHPLPLTLVSSSMHWPPAPLLSVGLWPGPLAPRAGHGAHVCHACALCAMASAAGETDSFGSRCRITGEGEDCPGWGQLSPPGPVNCGQEPAILCEMAPLCNRVWMRACVCMCVLFPKVKNGGGS